MKTSSGPLRIRNIKVKIKCSEKYAEPDYDYAGVIFLRNPLLKAAEFHVKGFFEDRIDHLASLDFGTILSTDELNKVSEFGIKFRA